MKIEFITSNPQKFEEASHILSEWELEQVNMDLTEIQGNKYEIVKAKAKEAFHILKRPLIVEDVSLSCPALGGLPGPYVKDFLKSIGDVGIYELIHHYSNHFAQAACVVGYIKPGIEPLLFEGTADGIIVAPRGTYKHGWNTIFQPKGSSKTYGEMDTQERSQNSMRRMALMKLKHFLQD